MNISAWFRNWLNARRAGRPPLTRLNHAARLSLRKLEDRQVLSVSASILGGVLDVHVADANQVVTLSVDSGGHLVIDGSLDGHSNQHQVMDPGSFSSIHLTADAAANQSVEFHGVHQLDLTGVLTVDTGVEHIIVDSEIHAGDSIHLSADDIVLSGASELTTGGAELTLHASTDITLADGAAIHADHAIIDLWAQDTITIFSHALIHNVGGTVLIDAGSHGTSSLSGTVDVSDLQSGGVGGTVHILGNHIGLFDAAIVDASGDAGGGTVLIGGDYQGHNDAIHNADLTYVGTEAVIHADALTQGAGGRIIVWADQGTRFYGDLSAHGAVDGHGGFAEVSGQEWLSFAGTVDLAGPLGGGMLLLDPKNITVASGGAAVLATNDAFTENPTSSVTIAAATITAVTNTGVAVVLQANNDITINQNIITNRPAGVGGALTLQAGRSVLINANLTTDDAALTIVANETTANGVVNANRDTGSAVITMAGGTTLNSGNGSITITLSTGAGLTHNTSGNIALVNLTTTNTVTVANNGPTAGSGIDFGGTANIGGNLSASANGPITDGTTGNISVTGNASFTGTTITLGDSAGNTTNFGTLTFSGTAVTISEDSDTVLTGTNLASSLALTSSGSITDASGTSLSVSGQATLNAGGNAITLGDNAGDTTNLGSLTFTGGAVAISEDSDTVLANSSTATSLVLTSSATITDGSSGDISVTGNASFTGTTITLGDNPGNTTNFNSLTFSGGAVNISEDSDTVLSGSSTASSLVLTSSATITDDTTGNIAVTGNTSFSGTTITLGDSAGNTTNFVSLTFSGTAVTISEDSDTELAGSSTASSLMLTSSATITDGTDGDIAVTGNASFTGTTITLGDSTGNTTNFVSLTFSGTAVTISEDSDTELAGSSTASSLMLTSSATITDGTDGDIAVTGNASFTGTTITLGDSTGNTTNFVSLTFSGTAVTISEDSDTVLAGSGTATSLVLTSSSTITDITAGNISVTGNASFSGTAITLGDDPSNTTNFGSLTVASVGAVQISEDSSTSLTGSSTAGSLTLNSTGTISDGASAVIAVTGQATLTATSTITLGNSPGNTTDFGSLTFSGTVVTISEDSDTVLAGSSTATRLVLTSTGTITDGTSGNIAVSDNASFTGNAITLGDDPGNATNFGSLTFTSAGAVNISEDSDTLLFGSNTAGSLVLTSTATISDGSTADIAVTGNASFTGTAITLGDSNSNTTNFGSLTFSGTAVTIGEDSATVLTGTNSASSLALTSNGSLTDASGTSLTVSGQATLNAGGNSITLGDNVGDTTNFGSLTFTGGAVAISEDSDTVLTNSSTASSLVLTSSATITDGTDGDLSITGNASFSDTAITLGNDAGNTTNFGSLTFTSTGAVSISEDSDTVLSGSSTADSLVLTSTATITDETTGDIAVTGNADFSGTAITLGNDPGNTSNFGSLTFSGTSVLISEASNMDLAGSSTGTTVQLSASGSINDASASATIITAMSLALSATSGIGNGDAMETAVVDLAFRNTTIGNVQITNTGALTINNVGGLATSSNTGAGTTTLIASGPLTFAVNTSSEGTLTATATDGAVINTENITVNSRVTVESTSGDVLFEAGDRIILNATAIVRSTSAGGNVTLESGFGDIDGDGAMTLDGTVSAGATSGVVTLDLQAQQGATQVDTGTITGHALQLLSSGFGGSFDLSSATNSVSTLAANSGGAIHYRNAAAFDIGTVTTGGITTTDDNVTVCLVTGNLTVTGDVSTGTAGVTTGTVRFQTLGGSISGAGTITAAALGLRSTGAGAGISLTSNLTNVDTLAATTSGAFAFEDTDGFALGTVTALGCFTPGVTGLTAGGNVELCVKSGDIALDAALSASGFMVRLDAAAGSVTQSMDGVITATNLGVHAQNDIDLGSADNAVIGVFAARSSTLGDIAFHDVSGFTIGSVTAGTCLPLVTGVTAASGDIELCADSGDIALEAAVSAVGSTVRLDAAAGSVTQTLAGLITTGNFGVRAQNAIDLDNADNDIAGTLAALSTTLGDIEFADLDGFTVGTVTAGVCLPQVVGITATSGHVVATSTGSITVNQLVWAPGDITLSATGSTSDLSISANSGVSSNGGHIHLNADQTVTISEGVSTTGTGSITVSGNAGAGARNILVNSGAVASVVDGSLLLDADQGTQVAGDFVGVDVNDALIQSTGVGTVTVEGRGGDDGAGSQIGVQVRGGGDIIGGTMGLLTVQGIGGASAGGTNFGVQVTDAGSTITSGGGNVRITGIEGGGVSGVAIQVASSGAITTATNGGTVTLIGNSMSVDGTSTISAQNASSVTILQRTNGVAINLGTVGDPIGGPLNLSEAELDRITAGELHIGNSNSGAIEVTNDIILSTGFGLVGTLCLTSGSTVTGTAGGVVVADLSILAVGTVNFTDATTNVMNLAIDTGTVGGSSDNVTFVNADGFNVITICGETGIDTDDGSVSLTATTGDITVVNTGAANDIDATTGVTIALHGANNVFTVNGGARVLTTSGGMTITADNMALTGTLSASGQTVVLQQKTDTRQIDLGNGEPAGQLSLTDGELGNITASRLDIGNASSGAIMVSSDIDLTDSPAITTLCLQTGGSVTASTGGIVVSDLAVVAGGAVSFTSASTNVTDLAIDSSTGNVTFKELDDLTVTTVCGVTGIDATGDITISLLANNALFTINSGADIETTKIASGLVTISADKMNLAGSITTAGQTVVLKNSVGADAIDLGSATDSAASVLELSDAELDRITASRLIIGSPTMGAITFISGIDLTDGPVITTLHLLTSAGITASAGGVQVADLAISANGNVAFTNVTSDVDMLAVTTIGTVQFTDEDGLTIGTVDGVVGLTTTNDDVKLIVGDAPGESLSIEQAVGLGTGHLYLDVAGNVTQTAPGTITAAGLALQVDGTTTLGLGNDVDTLAANTGGTVLFNDSDDLIIGTVTENASPAAMSITGITTSDDHVSITSATGNLTLDQAISTGTGDVTLQATTGSILDGNDGHTLISAHDLSLTAQTNIGDITDFAAGTGDAIEVQLSSQLTSASISDAGGEIFLNFQGNLTAAAGSVNVAGANTASAILRATGGDIDVGTAVGVFSLSSGDNLGLEAIRVGSSGGVLTLPDAGFNVGTGDLRLRGDQDVKDVAGRVLGPLVADDLAFKSGASGGNTTLTTTINTLTALVTGSGADLVVQETNGITLTEVDTTDGSITITTGGTTIVTAVDAGTAGSDVSITASTGNVTVNHVTAGTGAAGDDVSLAATSGAILDDGSNAAGSGITGGLVTLTASGAIGATGANNDIDTSAVTLITTSGTGGTYVTELDGVALGSGAGGNTSTGPTVIVAGGAITTGNGITTTANNAAIDISTTSGGITLSHVVTAHGSGDATLNAAGLLTVYAVVSSTTGDLSLTGGTGVMHNASGDLTTTGVGTIGVTATTGNITMADGTVYSTGSGAVTLLAGTNVVLGEITTTSSAIVVTATGGALTETTAAETANLTGGTATLSAATGIGSGGGGADIDTTITTLVARNSTSGNIVIQETNGLIIGGTGVRTQLGNGNINIDVDAGNLTVDRVVTAHGSGSVTLNADAGTVDINAEVSSTTGVIVLTGDSVTQDANITTGGSGTVDVTADTGSITMADGTKTTSDTGAITYSATANVALDQLKSTSGSLNVTADSDASGAGAITDSTAGEAANLVTTGTATLSAATGIGSAGGAADLDTTIGTLVATNTTTGNIFVQETSGLIIGGTGVRTLLGHGNIGIDVDAGSLTVNKVVTAHGDGNVTLNVDAGAANLNAAISTTSGDIGLTADSVNQNSGGNLSTGTVLLEVGKVTVTADNGSITMADGTTTTTGTGSISYSATGSVALSLLTSTSGAIHVTAGSGASVVGAITDNTVGESANLVTTGTATLVAETGIGSAGGNSDIDTTVAKLSITNSISGNIDLTEADAVTVLQLSQCGGGNATLRTVNGTITVDNAGAVPNAITFTSGGTLLLDANGVSSDVIVNDGIQAVQGHVVLQADRDIVATSAPIASSGGSGSIVLQAVHDIRILDPGHVNPVDVSVAGLGAIRLSASTGVIVLGSQNPNTTPDVTQHTVANDVVLQTGTGAVTNTLPLVYDIRAPQIDSQGQVFLTMTIGRPGEHNLTVTVFWGDNSQTTKSFANPGTYTFSHQYFRNPNPLDQAAPVLINVQVSHDPHVVLTAQNVNTPVGSVPDNGVPAPPPVPAQNINADLSSAVYGGDARAAAAGPFSGTDTKLLSAPGNETNPGLVIFQDTTLRAIVVPVPGDGLASFPFDVAPPVELIGIAEAAKIYDTLQQASVQLSEGSTVRIAAVQSDDTQLSERRITLEVISPDGTVQQGVVLPEKVLDDLLDVISKLPDGKYRFQIREPGEDRLRLLLEVEVRQGKIVGEDEATDRPPSAKKKPGNRGAAPMSPPVDPESTPDATNEAIDPEESIMQVLPDHGMPRDSIVRESQELWGGWSSGVARRAWRRAESVGTFRVDQDDSSGEVSLATPDAPAQLSRAAQLFRKFSKSVES